MSVICYSSKKDTYNIKHDDMMIFVYDKFPSPPFWELKIDKIPGEVKRTDLNEEILFRKRNDQGCKKTVTLLEFELTGKYELRVTHQGFGANENLSHVITIIVSKSSKKSCTIS